MARSTAVAGALIATGTFLALLVAWGTPWLTNDSLWALAWGGELIHGKPPSLTEPGVSTPHPLTNLIAAGAHLFGATAGYWTIAAIGVLCFALIVALVFLAGSMAFGVATGLVAAVVVATIPDLVTAGTSGLMDLLFVALVLSAVVAEVGAGRPRTGLVLLALAGLVRPEAWLLSGAYSAFVVWRRRERAAIAAALTLAAPVIWLGVDLVTTGSALHSLTHTQEGARDLRRTTGLANVPTAARTGLEVLLTRPVLLGGAVGFVLALATRRRAAPLLAVGLVGGLTYVLLGIADLSLLDRYLVLPAIVLAVAFAYALTGWIDETGRARVLWAAGAAALAVYALTAGPSRIDALRTAKARSAANARLVASLRRFDDNRALGRALDRCGRVVVRDQRGRALLVNDLGLPVDRVVDGRRTRAGDDDLFVTVDAATMRRESLALFPADPSPPAAGAPARFRLIAAHGGWEALAGPACR
jgi:hypothetical protein